MFPHFSKHHPPSSHTLSLILLLLLVSTTSAINLTNICLGGQQISNINSKQKAFNKGNCSPVILVPGFLGTALQVEIDCPVLMTNHPEIFEDCGWNTCNSKDIRSILKMPNKEYRLWIGDLTDKFSVIQTQDQKCLAKFLKFEEGQEKQYVEPKGMKVTWVGNTPSTSSQSKCGVNAVQNLLGKKVPLIRNCALKGYEESIIMLENMGYISGINYQVIPYDWRKTVEASEAGEYIKKSISNLYKNTGKKVVLYGHSYGNLHLLNVLQGMKLEEKDQKVKHFISVGAPYLGAAKTLKSIIGGDAGYTKTFLSMQLGFNYHSQEALTLSSRSLVHFFPRFNLLEFKNDEWYNQTINNYPSWLPREDSSYPLGQLLKMSGQPVLKVNNYPYVSQKQSYQKMFGLMHNNKTVYYSELLEEGFNPNNSLFKLQKPDVNTTLIFAGGESTEIRYSYDTFGFGAPFKSPYQVLVGGGDGTVSSISNLIPAVKWIYEQNKGGVKLLNYGASTKISNQYYDTIDSQCTAKGTSNCQHACYHQDPNVLNYLSSLLTDGGNGTGGRLAQPNCENLKVKK